MGKVVSSFVGAVWRSRLGIKDASLWSRSFGSHRTVRVNLSSELMAFGQLVAVIS